MLLPAACTKRSGDTLNRCGLNLAVNAW